MFVFVCMKETRACTYYFVHHFIYPTFVHDLILVLPFQLDAKKQESNIFIALFTLICIAVGFVVFIFIPAGIFMVLDYWSYLEAVYFAVITLTTVGFGDLLTGKVDDVILVYS